MDYTTGNLDRNTDRLLLVLLRQQNQYPMINVSTMNHGTSHGCDSGISS